MKLLTVPTLNEDLFAFDLRFKGLDNHAGERHFLEHMVFNDNKHYKGEAFRDELAKAGAGDFFSACTTGSEIRFNGMYLKKDERRITQLLNMILNDCELANHDIEKERKIILEEEAFGRDNMIRQAWVTLSKVMNYDFSVIGSTEDIKKIDREMLVGTYKDVMCDVNAELTVHNADVLVNNLKIEDRAHAAPLIQPIIPQHINESNDEMSSSVMWMNFNETSCLKSNFLDSYLSHTAGPLFTNMREKDKLAYAVGASDAFYSYDIANFFSLYCITTEHYEIIFDKFLENMVVDKRFVYDALIKEKETLYAKAKNSPILRMWMQRYAARWGISYGLIIDSLPSYEELQSYCEEVKSKAMGTIAIIGTKES